MGLQSGLHRQAPKEKKTSTMSTSTTEKKKGEGGRRSQWRYRRTKRRGAGSAFLGREGEKVTNAFTATRGKKKRGERDVGSD